MAIMTKGGHCQVKRVESSACHFSCVRLTLRSWPQVRAFPRTRTEAKGRGNISDILTDAEQSCDVFSVKAWLDDSSWWHALVWNLDSINYSKIHLASLLTLRPEDSVTLLSNLFGMFAAGRGSLYGRLCKTRTTLPLTDVPCIHN